MKVYNSLTAVTHKQRVIEATVGRIMKVYTLHVTFRLQIKVIRPIAQLGERLR